MKPLDIITYIARSIRSAGLRTLLTALGIAIGISAVVLLTAIGEGVRFYVMDNFTQFGTRIVAINPGKNLTQGMGGLFSTNRPLTLDDAEAMRNLAHVQSVVPIVQGAGEIRFN